VDSIASIHELIYRTVSFTDISAREYFKKMLNSISELHSNKEQTLKIKIKIQEFLLNFEQALPLALIVNEVLTNIYKHAFKNYSNAEIIFNLSAKGNNIHLQIKDNGKGFDKSIDTSNTLGFEIIKGLADKLNARYSYSSEANAGSNFNLECSLKAKKKVGKIQTV
jgi:two-component sensor histidine kinase